MLRNASKKTNPKPKGRQPSWWKGESAFPFPNALANTFVSLGKLYLSTAKFPQPNYPVQGFQEMRVKRLRETV